MTILLTNIEARYTQYGHIFALSASVSNTEEAKRKIDVTAKITLENPPPPAPPAPAPLATAKGEQLGIELKELETQVLDIVLNPPFQIKDEMQTVWQVIIVEKRK